jgi:hypothetical protein
MKFDFYSDPGHGWLAVELELLDHLQLLDKITSYSYVRGGMAYLEEDLDAGVLLAALRHRGVAVAFRERVASKYSRIRNYDPFSAARAREFLDNGRTWRPAWRIPTALQGLALNSPAAV